MLKSNSRNLRGEVTIWGRIQSKEPWIKTLYTIKFSIKVKNLSHTSLCKNTWIDRSLPTIDNKNIWRVLLKYKRGLSRYWWLIIDHWTFTEWLINLINICKVLLFKPSLYLRFVYKYLFLFKYYLFNIKWNR